MPERPQRELRDLTWTRTSLLQDKARVANRLQKALEDANIKLGSVASERAGGLGRDMIPALIEGKMSPGIGCGRRSRSWCRPCGAVREHHRFAGAAVGPGGASGAAGGRSMARIEAVMSLGESGGGGAR